MDILPVRRNPNNNQLEKLVSFDIKIKRKNILKNVLNQKIYPNASVLSSGKWVKIKIKESGIYQISFDKLNELGFSQAENVAIYGRGGMLSKVNEDEFPTDLEENASWINGNSIVFYAQGADTWDFKGSRFEYIKHDYSDASYYFISDRSTGKRITTAINPNESHHQTITTFQDLKHHEEDLENFIHTGRNWYGENFDIYNSQDFNFSFPNIVNNIDVKLTTNLLAKSSNSSTTFIIKANGETVKSVLIPRIPSTATYTHAVAVKKTLNFLSNQELI